MRNDENDKHIIGEVSKVTCKGTDLRSQLNDDKYLECEFIEFLRNRLYEIVEHRGVRSSISAANAVKDHLRDWHFGNKEGENVAMCVLSDGNPYGIAPRLIFSFPVEIKDEKWAFAKGHEFNAKMKEMIDETEKELESEMEKAQSLFK